MLLKCTEVHKRNHVFAQALLFLFVTLWLGMIFHESMFEIRSKDHELRLNPNKTAESSHFLLGEKKNIKASV